MSLRLTLRGTTTIPLEVEGLTPDALRDKTLAQVERWPVFHGNRQLPLAELFRVEGDAADQRIEFDGDMSSVHWIGAHMKTGTIHVAGHAGRHVGSEMTGGEITVDGNAGDHLGGEMHDGLIRVRGNAGDHVGGAYPGSEAGMTGGILLVHGSAGEQAAHTMRRGLVVIGGAVGDFAGINMIAGSLFVFGACGMRPAAGMRRGTLAVFDDAPTLLPTFRSGGRCQPLFLRVYLRTIERIGFPIDGELLDARYEVFHGDLLNGGRGEILVRG